jgi:hypothetical protein
MNYDDRPGLSAYDPDVAAESLFPDCSVNEVSRETARAFPDKHAPHFLGNTLA